MNALLLLLFFLIAIIYAAVGQGGGSGYLAAMGVMGITPDVMKPTALTLNILVAGIASVKFYRSGHFSGLLFWPIAFVSIPFAFLGGRLSLPFAIYRPLVGFSLLFAAYRLFRYSGDSSLSGAKSLPVGMAIVAGAGIGLLSGMVGIGGGIFLGPLLLLGGWADTHQTMGISAAFVLVNSLSGLLGHLSSTTFFPDKILLWLGIVAVGGWIGAEFGSRQLNPVQLRRLLAWVLVIGSLRMFFV